MKYLGSILYWGFFLLLLLFMANALGYCRTKVEGNTRGTAVWRKGYVIAAFTDGWLCYGTANNIACHRAIPKPTYKEITW